MKVFIFIILMFSCFSCRTDRPEEDNALAQAEKLMLSDPKKSFGLARNLLKEHSLTHENKVRSLFVLTNTSNILEKPLDVIKYGNLTLENATEDNDLIIKIKALTLLGNTYQSIQLTEKLRTNLDQAEQLLSSSAVPDSMNVIRGNIFYLNIFLIIQYSEENSIGTLRIILYRINLGFCKSGSCFQPFHKQGRIFIWRRFQIYFG